MPEAEADGGPGRLRVMVVEDDGDGADSLALLLRMHGHEPRVARDGPAALGEAEGCRPHVVLLDIGLPGLNGYEVARQLRARAGSGPALLIAVSGYADDEARLRGPAAGIDLHLAKPADFDQLQAILLSFRRVLLPN